MNLGPIILGDKPILEHDLTHATSGLPLYPAFDAGWRPGDVVIAPEKLTVTRHSGGPTSGYSFYAEGVSGIRYYVTHLNWARVAPGTSVPMGGRLGTVGTFVGSRVPHAHVGINVEKVLGAGRELRHNTNYTHGQPTIGTQLPILPEPAPLRNWPVPIPAWFWAWNKWKEKGQVGPRPPVPTKFGIVPPWAWRRRAAFIAAKK